MVTSLGTGSGLDLESLLNQLLTAEARPVETRLALQEADVQASISAFGSLKGALSDFQSAINNLDNTSNFNGRSASSSDTGIFTASADNSAAEGSYNINVLNLAQAQKLISGDFAEPSTVVGTGTLSISVGASSFDVAITSGTLTDIRDAVNDASDNTGVTATILTVDELDGFDQPTGNTVSRLVFTADETGSSNAIEIVVDDDDLGDEDNTGLSQLFYQDGNVNNQLTQLTAAEDAQITIDGLSVSNSTNTFSSAITGVTITAISESPDVINDPPEVLSVTRDTASVQSNIETFVEAYNSLAGTLRDLSSSDPENGVSAPLSGDFTVRTLESQIRRVFFTSFSGLDPAADNLVDLGITTTESGDLEIDSTALTTALNNNLADVEAIFSGTQGIATQLDDLVDNYLGTTGIISGRENGLNDTLADINDERESLALRLDNVERRFRQQFAALDTLIAQLNSTGSFLTQQLANTAAIINRPADN